MSHEYQRVITPSSGLRLHLNENTAGCSPRVIEAIRSLTATQAAFYPDYEKATAACAARLGVQPANVLLTNGLDEGVFAISIAALRRTHAEAEAIVIVPAFDMYAACADNAGGKVIEVPCEREFAFPLDRVLQSIGPRTRLILLNTPNNPTGQTISRADMVRVAEAAPDALVFVDEAYADFHGDTLLGTPDFTRLPNVIVGRTFAKAYGLAGMRIGALVADARTLAALRRIVPPYSLNVCATLALQAALDDTEYYTWYLCQARDSKSLLYEALKRLGVRYWPSAANFVFVDLGRDARRVVEGLAARGIFVRDRSADPACPGCVRITTGVVEHTRACIGALEEVLCGAAS